MMNRIAHTIALTLVTTCTTFVAHAEDSHHDSLKAASSEDRPKFSLSGAIVYTDTPVSIDAIDLTLPEDAIIDDLDVSVGEELNLSSTTFQVSASYFPLPFLQISAKGGFVSSESDLDTAVSGTFPEDSILGIDTFDIALDGGRESDGVSYGLGTAVFVPFAKMSERPVILGAGAQVNFNDLDNVQTETVSGNISVLNAQRLLDRDVTFALGASYIQIDREVEYSAGVGGQDIGVKLTQSLDNPWGASASVVFPLDERLALSFTALNNFEGLQSYALILSTRF